MLRIVKCTVVFMPLSLMGFGVETEIKTYTMLK